MQDMEGDQSVIWAQRGSIQESILSTAELNDLYLDTSFAGTPQQCDPETCEIMRDTLHFRPTVGLEDSNTVRLPLTLLSSSLLFFRLR